MSSSIRAYASSSRGMKVSPTTMTAAARPRISRPVRPQPDIAARTARTQAVPTSSTLRKSPTATKSLPEDNSDIWIQIAAEEAAKKAPAVKVSSAKESLAARTKMVDEFIAASRARRQATEERLNLRAARLASQDHGSTVTASSRQQTAPVTRPQRTRVPSRGQEAAPELKGPPKRGSRLIIRAVSISTIASDSDNSSLGRRTPSSSTSTSSNEQMSRISLKGLRNQSSSTIANEQMSRISARRLRFTSSSSSTIANEHMSRISVEPVNPIDFDLSFDGAFEGTILEATTKPALKSCLKRPSTKASVKKNVAFDGQYMVRIQDRWIDPARHVFSERHVWACGKMRRFGTDNYLFGDYYEDTHIGCGCTYERLQSSPGRRFA